MNGEDDKQTREPEATHIVLASGRRVEVDATDSGRINVLSPDGTFELAISFTAAGPVLRLSAAALELHTTGALRLACEDFALEARNSVAVRAGSFMEEIGGARVSTVGGTSTLEAHAVRIRARLGDMALEANDYFRATGEKILLNS